MGEIDFNIPFYSPDIPSCSGVTKKWDNGRAIHTRTGLIFNKYDQTRKADSHLPSVSEYVFFLSHVKGNNSFSSIQERVKQFNWNTVAMNTPPLTSAHDYYSFHIPPYKIGRAGQLLKDRSPAAQVMLSYIWVFRYLIKSLEEISHCTVRNSAKSNVCLPASIPQRHSLVTCTRKDQIFLERCCFLSEHSSKIRFPRALYENMACSFNQICIIQSIALIGLATVNISLTQLLGRSWQLLYMDI